MEEKFLLCTPFIVISELIKDESKLNLIVYIFVIIFLLCTPFIVIRELIKYESELNLIVCIFVIIFLSLIVCFFTKGE